MKNRTPTRLVLSGWLEVAAACFASASMLLSASGQPVFLTARPQPSGAGPNTNGGYAEINLTLGDTSSRGGAPGRPTVAGARAFLADTNLADSTAGFDLAPTPSLPCGLYEIAHNFSSAAGNVSTDVVLSATCTGGTLSFTRTDKFQSRYGNPTNVWQVLGYFTNTGPTPTLSFRYYSGTINAATMNRLVVDCFRCNRLPTCLLAPLPSVVGPLLEEQTQVEVEGIVSNAVAITVYQDSGTGMTAIGQKTSGFVIGSNWVPVQPLLRGARVAATQTLACEGESCLPISGIIVGARCPGPISISLSASNLLLDWTGCWQLQTACCLAGPWSDVGEATNGPCAMTISSSALFFRLRGN
jgi:hypothetical protein